MTRRSFGRPPGLGEVELVFASLHSPRLAFSVRQLTDYEKASQEQLRKVVGVPQDSRRADSAGVALHCFVVAE